MQEISLSVQETNKLRAQLGLPLIKEPGYMQEKSSIVRDDHRGENKESNDEREISASEASAIPKKEITPVFESINEQGDVFYDKVEDDWLNKVGQGTVEGGDSVSKRGAPAKEISGKVSVAHEASELSKLRDGDIFTLEDHDILQDDTGDILENEAITKEAKKRQQEAERKKIDKLKYGVRGEEEEEEKNGDKGRSLTVEGTEIKMTAPPQPESDIDMHGLVRMEQLFPEEERRGPIKMKLVKKDKHKADKKRKRREDEALPAPPVPASAPMKTEELQEEFDVDEQEEMEKSLARARDRKQKRRKLTEPVPEPAEPAEPIEELDGFVYDGAADFLGTIDSEIPEIPEISQKQVKSESSAEPAAAPAADGAAEIQPEPAQAEPTGFSSMAATLRQLRRNGEIGDRNGKREAEKQEEQLIRKGQLDKIAISVEQRKLKEELEADDGYKRLPEEEKVKVMQRLLEERVNVQDAINEGNWKPTVKLEYQDEAGNKLDQKRAFKQLSHKFHGTRPNARKTGYRGARSSDWRVL